MLAELEASRQDTPPTPRPKSKWEVEREAQRRFKELRGANPASQPRTASLAELRAARNRLLQVCRAPAPAPAPRRRCRGVRRAGRPSVPGSHPSCWIRVPYRTHPPRMRIGLVAPSPSNGSQWCGVASQADPGMAFTAGLRHMQPGGPKGLGLRVEPGAAADGVAALAVPAGVEDEETAAGLMLAEVSHGLQLHSPVDHPCCSCKLTAGLVLGPRRRWAGRWQRWRRSRPAATAGRRTCSRSCRQARSDRAPSRRLCVGGQRPFDSRSLP